MSSLSAPASTTKVGIGIATKDRWGDLAVTLQQLSARGYDRHPTLVVDDGSSVPVPDALRERYPRVRFIRHERSRGYIVRRTEIASLLATPFILTLDDDSHPLEGSLDEAAAFLEARPAVAVLAFNILCGRSTVPKLPPGTAPFPVQRFLGCGHLLRRAAFLGLGGYRAELIHYTEEGELCARLLRYGWEVHYFPSLLIRHNQVVVGRNHKRIAYYQGRNRALLALWHFPWWALPARLATALIGTFAIVPRHAYGSGALGFLAGLAVGARLHRHRKPLSSEQYVRWRRLPWVSQQYHDPDPDPALAARSQPA